jgi:hypothetical protein
MLVLKLRENGLGTSGVTQTSRLSRCAVEDIHVHYAWRPAVDFYSGIGIGWLNRGWWLDGWIDRGILDTP